MRARSFVPLVAAALLALTVAPIAEAAVLPRDEFEAILREMQTDVEDARALYAAGDAAGALVAAHRVADRFTYDSSGASDVEETMKDASAMAIGEKVKALSARLVAAIDAGRPVADVDAIADELSPNLNRLVLVAQGKTSAASQRTLRTPEAIDAAVDEVLDKVDEALRLEKRGQQDAAVEMARDAFFAFEINGLGPDTSTVDDDLENRGENLIVNFDAATAETNPGLAQLLEKGADRAAVEARADDIREALAQISELLKATLPPLSLGDANGDTRVTIVDALFVAQAALGIREKTEEMDANRDGRVTIVDALLIAQVALGIRSL